MTSRPLGKEKWAHLKLNVTHNFNIYCGILGHSNFEVHQKKNNPIVQLVYLERNKNRLSNEQLKYILTFLGQMFTQCNETI